MTTKSKNAAEFDNEELLALARFDMEQNKVDAALLKIKQVLVDEVDSIAALSMGGKIYAQLGLFDKAKSCFSQLLEIDGDSVTEKFQYGMVHFDSGDSARALDIWAELLNQQPTHPPTLFYKGLALAQEGNTADARSTLSILLQSAPADNLYFGRAKELLQAIDQGDKGQGERSTDVSSGMSAKDAYKVIN